MVYSHLSYCNIIWGGASKLALNRLTTLQKRAVRVIAKVKCRTSTSELFKKFNILKLHNIYELSLSMFMYNLTRGLLPQCCYNFVHLTSVKHTYSLRSDNKIVKPVFHSKVRERCIAVAGPAAWYTIPNSLKNSITARSFKKSLVPYLQK